MKNTRNIGNLIVIIGPPAAGKDTILKYLTEKVNLELNRIVSYNTRPRRENEVEGYDHYFVSENEFMELVDKEELVEYEKHGSHWKGTHRGPFEEILRGEKNYVWRITNHRGGTLKEFFTETYGNEKGKTLFARTTTLYIGPNDKETLLQRYKKRENNPDIKEFEKRFQEDIDAWRKFKDRYDYVLHNKGSLQKTLKQAEKIVRKIVT